MKRILVLIVAISAIAVFAGHVFGQNTGNAPYLDSEHAYALKIGKAANTKRWVVTDKVLPTPESHEITTATDASFDWFDITPATVDGGNEMVEIFFKRSVFTHGNGDVGGIWYLQYFEDQLQADGTTTCVSAREFQIVISENSFYLLVGADGTKCNDESDDVHAYQDFFTDGTYTTAVNFPTTVTYSVTMNKDAAYQPSGFRFEATFNQTPTALAVSVPAAQGTASYTLSGSTYTVTVIPPTSETVLTNNTIAVSLSVTFSNPVLASTTPELTVDNGQAYKNGTPPAITNDNTDIHPVSPLTPGDRTQAITIHAIPSTRDIVPGADETTWSASNPLQNSTHKYSVQVGALGNTYEWTVLNSDQSPLAAASNYTLVPTNPTGAETNALVSITYLSTMGTGSYIVQFKETAATGGCSTIRRYPITLGGPFDVDIVASELTTCAAISGQINNSPGTETVTTVQYEVELKNSTYVGDWKFDLGFSSDPGFDADLNLVTGGISLSSGGTLSGSTVTVENTTTPLRKVTVTVQYTGFYNSAHEITATLTNITGSYAEQDADGTNETMHTIYAMPQAGTLAGVD